MIVKYHPGEIYNYWSVSDDSFDHWANHADIMLWCTENFGPPTWRAPDRGKPGWSKFKDTVNINLKDDLTLFLLRWGD